MAAKRKQGGHPARQDDATDRLFRTMRATVELVRELDGRLSPDADVHLRAAALGMMTAYAELTGLPAPIQILGGQQQ